jgi:hypothetical protein
MEMKLLILLLASQVLGLQAYTTALVLSSENAEKPQVFLLLSNI